MLKFKKIDIEHRSRVVPYLETGQIGTTERNFACIFVWGDNYCTEIAIEDDFLYIRMKAKEEVNFTYYPPIGNGDVETALNKIFEVENRESITFYGLSKSQVEVYSQLLKTRATFDLAEANSDYMYNAVDLMTLVGKKFSAKRNHINKFMKLYGDNYLYRAIDFSNDYDELMGFFNKWAVDKNSDDAESYEAEYIAIQRAIKYADELDLKGGVLYVDDKIAAFTIGARTDDKTFDVLFEKGNIEIEGSYAMINQCFAIANYEEYTYINREEDLGICGLRKAKQSYNPVFINEKYRAVIRIFIS